MSSIAFPVNLPVFIGIIGFQRLGNIPGDDAPAFLVIMLCSPVLIDKIDIAHQIEVVNQGHILQMSITTEQIVMVLLHQPHQILAHHIVSLIDILCHQIKNQMPASFVAQSDNVVKIL